MDFPPPSPKQAKIFWLSVTALAWAVMLGLVGLLAWGGAFVLDRLSSVLMPLAIAAILAYILDPVVDFFESKGLSRFRVIIFVYCLSTLLLLTFLAWVMPRLVVETGDLVQNLPKHVAQLNTKIRDWLAQSHLGAQARQMWESQAGVSFQQWLAQALPAASKWMLSQATRAASWAGLIVGLALVPVYVFYFLLEKNSIIKQWKAYIPLRDSPLKEEIAFVMTAINDCLIVFCRGQVLVALCDGVILTAGFLLVGLNYAVLIGLAAGFLSIVPYLGITISVIPAVALAIVQYADWLHPVLVVGVFIATQLIEGFLITPKIIGDRVGMHPLTVMVAVIVGTTLLGGLIGGVLAIPLTAALRTLMFRYVWKKPGAAPDEALVA